MNWNYQGRGNGFTKAPYNPQYQPRFNKPQKKHSGAKFGFVHGEEGRPYVTGWNYSKSRGMVSIICSPYKGKSSETKRRTSKSGKVWENWKAKVKHERTMQTVWYNCLYDVNGRKVIIKDLGMVIKPSSPNGGYCGRFKK